ncbi:MAG: AmmeMemoRadiSam system protein A [Sedimentisphaerales bacterium]|nr:AmmeMemoRadiSam system protein A [Sedimentisphaerales bacterium]
MNESQRRALLKVAKDTVEAVITRKRLPEVEADDPDLDSHLGCFVTLKNHDQLRGCIGQFIADRPLVQMVVEMAKASATSDPRFFGDPITPDELPNLDIEISVLSPLKKTTDPLSLRLGVDGIYIKRGHFSGCFLPQVATETGWTKEEFLSYCCSHKAGLPPNAWKDPKTEVLLFTAEVFGSALKDI